MRDRLRALGIALAIPFGYQLIQLLVNTAGGVMFSMSWVQGNDILDMDALNQAVLDYLIQNGLQLLFVSALIGMALSWLLLRREPAPDRVNLFKPPSGSSCALLVLCGLSLNVLVVVLLALIPFPETAEKEYLRFTELLTGQGPVLQFVVGCLAVPLAEELIFRGLSYRTLRRVFPVRAALVMQALLFASFHGNPIQIAGVFPAALVLGLVYEWSGSLIAPILLHIAFNSANALLILLAGAPGGENLLLLVILLAGVGATVSIRGLHRRRRTDVQCTM